MSVVTDMSTTATARQHKPFRKNDQENWRYADVVVMPMWASDPAHDAPCRATQVGITQT